MEQWKSISGYRGLYEVSNIGNVRSHNRSVLKLSLTSNGYYKVRLYDIFGGDKTLRVHRLVATEFVDNPENKKIVNHKDGNKLNNADTNLEWNTSAENNEHALLMGLNKRVNGQFVSPKAA